MHLPGGILVYLFHYFVIFSYPKPTCPVYHPLIGKGLAWDPCQRPRTPGVTTGEAEAGATTRPGRETGEVEGGSFSPWRG